MTDTFTITSIKRDFTLLPNIVGIVTTANLGTITADGYLSDEDTNIQILNNGEFQWEPEDICLIYYATNQIGFFQRDVVNETFTTLSSTDTAVIEITSAQIKGMYATPIELLPAPNPGQVIIIDSIDWDITYGGAQYTGGGVIAAQYGPVNHGGGTAAAATIAAATLNAISVNTILIEFAATTLNTNRDNIEDAGIYLTNQTAAFATGTSNATLTVRYHVIGA